MLIIVRFRTTVIFQNITNQALLPAILLNPIEQNGEMKSRIDFTDINRTVHMLTVMHTIKNFSEKKTRLLFLIV